MPNKFSEDLLHCSVLLLTVTVTYDIIAIIFIRFKLALIKSVCYM
jgi:hypothetical protein